MRGRPKIYLIDLTEFDKKKLNQIICDKTEKFKVKKRAEVLLLANEQFDVKDIMLKTHSSKAMCYRVIKKYLSLGVDGALHDLKRKGRPAIFSEEAKIYIRQIACQKPYNLDKSLNFDIWSLDLLIEYIHKNCKKAGYPELETIVKASVFNILKKTELKLNLERMQQNKNDLNANIFLYKRIEFLLTLKQDFNTGNNYLTIAYDDKSMNSYNRNSYSTKFSMSNTILSLMLGVNLLTGQIYHKVCFSHTKDDFFNFIDLIEKNCVYESKVNIILDDNRIHAMHDTFEYLKTKKLKFNFIFQPKHSYFINLFDTFLSKFIRVSLNGLTADTKDNLSNEIAAYFEKINSCPYVFRFDDNLDDIKNYIK